jgi:hypothetical protein
MMEDVEHPSNTIYKYLKKKKSWTTAQQIRKDLDLSFGEFKTGRKQLLIRNMIQQSFNGRATFYRV